ncbi:MAG: class I SAM-dependent methyltransferase [Thermoanaerobacteraceae bacterium]|nr:class I SAM-dependent methyltransferase [Thermoanaerobacteraceae bacterium]
MECILCRYPAKVIKGTQKTYYHCSNCDLIFLDERFLVDSETEKSRYLEHDNTLENAGYVNMFNKFIANAVIPYTSGHRHVLDFGSGPGPVLKVLLERQGFTVEIYDPYFAPRKFSGADKFDIITCTEVIEHIYTPRETWEFFCVHLKPGGLLAMMTLFHRYPEQFQNWWYKEDITHVAFYSKRTFSWITEHYPLKLFYIDSKNTLTLQRI